MSCSYADGLSPYENKGKLGLKETFDPLEVVKEKVKILSDWITNANHVVIHTGAGISTTAGIPDFRGPKGVWTLEAKGEKPTLDISFDDAVPTKTHMAILKLVQSGFVKYIISQNIDGLHLKSGLHRDFLSELHGNMYIEECRTCNRQFVMKKATSSVGQKCLGKRCPSKLQRPCRGKTFDTILDWEAGLPEQDLDMAYYHSIVADVNICLGTTLQINPSGNLPLNSKKKYGGKLVICNLQPTKHDKKADLIINTYVDEMMTQLMGELDLKISDYLPQLDPTKHESILEWTISKTNLNVMKTKYQQVLKEIKKTTKRTAQQMIKLKKDSNPSKKIKSEFNKESLPRIKKEIKDEVVSSVLDEQAVNCDSQISITQLPDSQDRSKSINIKNSEELLNKIHQEMRTEDEIDSGFSETPDEGS